MNYTIRRSFLKHSTSAVVPFRIIASKVSHLSNSSVQTTLAPIVAFDENGDIPFSIPTQSPDSKSNLIVHCCCTTCSLTRFRSNFHRLIVQWICSQLGLFILVLFYIALGGLIFYLIESKYETQKKEEIKIKHLQGIHNIRHIATNEFNWMLNVSFELRYALWRGMLSRLDGYDDTGWRVQVHSERFDRLIEDELARMQAEEEKLSDKHDTKRDAMFNQKWTLSTAMLYSATIITTVGYGNITPKSILGKLITCLYAVIGIPIMIMYLTNTGDLLAFFFIKYYSVMSHLIRRIISRYRKQRRVKLAQKIDNRNRRYRVPVTVTIGVLALYITAGALLFSHWEGWSYIDAAYFSFITFTTIGLGDFVPGKGTLADNKSGKSILCALYLLYGLVLTTMCFKLVQDDLFAIKRRFFVRLGFDNYRHHNYRYQNRRYGMHGRHFNI